MKSASSATVLVVGDTPDELEALVAHLKRHFKRVDSHTADPRVRVLLNNVQ